MDGNSIQPMHFKANTKEDIVYYMKSIADIKGLYFESIENRFGMSIIRCTKHPMDESTFNRIVEEVIREKSHGKVDFYDDPVGGIRIVIS